MLSCSRVMCLIQKLWQERVSLADDDLDHVCVHLQQGLAKVFCEIIEDSITDETSAEAR